MSAETFKAAWWLRGRHLQTLWPLLRRRKKIALRQERIELADGDFIDLAWTPNTSGPLVVVLHGLEGSVNSSYVQGILSALDQQGWRGVLMHFRGCGGAMNRLARTYHSGDTQDVAEVIKIIKQREPTTPMAVVAYSLGANVLLKWLGETRNTNPLVAAVAVSVPFELAKSVSYLQKGFSRIYDRYFVKALQQKVMAKFQGQAAPIRLPSLWRLRTLQDFDDLVTAPLHGFVNGEDYYTQSSCRQFLPFIEVPTLILHAADDPFVPQEAIPAATELPHHVQLEVTAGGGHVGFVTGLWPWRPTYWLEQRILTFLKRTPLINRTIT